MVRFWINMVKIFGFVVAFAISIMLERHHLSPQNVLHGMLLAMLGCSSVVAIIDVHYESVDIGRAFIVCLVGIIALIAGIDICLDVQMISPLADILFEIILLLILHLLLSLNDASMEGFASVSFYSQHHPRDGRFLVHLAFNVLPYAIGMPYVYFVARESGEERAILHALILMSSLILLAVVDEACRRSHHVSIFWKAS